MPDQKNSPPGNNIPPQFKAPQRPEDLERLETGLIDLNQIKGDATQGLFDALQAAKDKQAASNKTILSGVSEEPEESAVSKISPQTYLLAILAVILGASAWGLSKILAKSGDQLDKTIENRKQTQSQSDSSTPSSASDTTSRGSPGSAIDPVNPSAGSLAAPSQPGFDIEKERERIRLKERELELERERTREKERERERERELERERERERELERDREAANAAPAPVETDEAEPESPPPAEPAPADDSTAQ